MKYRSLREIVEITHGIPDSNAESFVNFTTVFSITPVCNGIANDASVSTMGIQSAFPNRAYSGRIISGDRKFDCSLSLTSNCGLIEPEENTSGIVLF